MVISVDCGICGKSVVSMANRPSKLLMNAATSLFFSAKYDLHKNVACALVVAVVMNAGGHCTITSCGVALGSVAAVATLGSKKEGVTLWYSCGRLNDAMAQSAHTAKQAREHHETRTFVIVSRQKPASSPNCMQVVASPRYKTYTLAHDTDSYLGFARGRNWS